MPDGKNQFHGTVIAAYQEKQSSMTVENTVGYNSFFYKEPLVNQFCHKITSFGVFWGGGGKGGGGGVKIMNYCDVFVKLKDFYFNLI